MGTHQSHQADLYLDECLAALRDDGRHALGPPQTLAPLGGGLIARPEGVVALQHLGGVLLLVLAQGSILQAAQWSMCMQTISCRRRTESSSGHTASE